MKKTLIILMSLLMMQCIVKKSKYYSPVEKNILKETIGVFDYGYGYAVKLDLDYIFEINSSVKKLFKKKKEFNKVLDSYSSEAVIGYYEKIYRLKLMTLYKMKRAKVKGKWLNYTEIEKYYLPVLNKYFAFLESVVVKREKAYGKGLKKRKDVIIKNFNDEMQKKKSIIEKNKENKIKKKKQSKEIKK